MAQTVDVDTANYYDTAEHIAIGFPAYRLLHFLFVVVPIATGADKFFHVLVNWDRYLAPLFPRITHIPAHTFMLGVGVIEIIIGFVTAIKPRVGSFLMAMWLGAIIINLISKHGFLDIALYDFGLCLSALALYWLSGLYSRPIVRGY
jgi:hypothetical protein